MLRISLAVGIVAEWVLGPAVHTLRDLGSASLRCFIAMLLCWMVLETGRAIWRSVLTLEDR